MSPKQHHPPGPPMMLGNMRERRPSWLADSQLAAGAF
jgi:hypothetical protein